MRACQNIEQKLNPICRRPPSSIFARAAITQLPIDVDEQHFAAVYTAATGNRPFDQNRQNNKFKMAAAAILNFIYLS